MSITDSWSLTSLLRVGHRVATLLDSTRESILALRYNFWRLQGTQSCRGKPVLICILALSLVFTPYLSNAVVSAKSPHYFSCPCSTEAVGIAHKPPRCENSRRQTDRQTDVTLAAHARRGLIIIGVTARAHAYASMILYARIYTLSTSIDMLPPSV